MKPTKKEGEYFLCPFVSEDNKCRIYDIAPYYCRVWPYAVMRRAGKTYLVLDSEEYCPSLCRRSQDELQAYVTELCVQLTTDEMKKFLSRYPKLILEHDPDYTVITELDLNII